MARKNVKNTDSNPLLVQDGRKKAIMAQVNKDQMEISRQNVMSVQEVVRGKSKEEILLVLQYYDNNVEQSIQAYLEDGAAEALSDWHIGTSTKTTSNKKKKRNKKKKAEDTTDMILSATSTSAPPGDEASASPTAITKQTQAIGKSSGAAARTDAQSLSNGIDENPHVSHGRNVTLQAPSGVNSSDRVSINVNLPNSVNSSNSSVRNAQQDKLKPRQKNARDKQRAPVSLPGDHVENQTDQHRSTGHGQRGKADQLTNESGGQQVQQSKQQGGLNSHQSAIRPHTLSGVNAGGGRERTISGQSTNSNTSHASVPSKGKPHAGLDRSLKDLQRQTTSLQRLLPMLKEKCDHATKDMKKVFREIGQLLAEREAQLQEELIQVEKEAVEMLTLRQDQATNLRMQMERAQVMSEREISTLRGDIKTFIGGRKADEDLGRATRFICDLDNFVGEIKKFGEVVPVKPSSQRRLSASSASSSHLGVDDNAPLTPLTPQTPLVPVSPAVLAFQVSPAPAPITLTQPAVSTIVTSTVNVPDVTVPAINTANNSTTNNKSKSSVMQSAKPAPAAKPVPAEKSGPAAKSASTVKATPVKTVPSAKAGKTEKSSSASAAAPVAKPVPAYLDPANQSSVVRVITQSDSVTMYESSELHQRLSASNKEGNTNWKSQNSRRRQKERSPEKQKQSGERSEGKGDNHPEQRGKGGRDRQYRDNDRQYKDNDRQYKDNDRQYKDNDNRHPDEKGQGNDRNQGRSQRGQGQYERRQGDNRSTTGQGQDDKQYDRKQGNQSGRGRPYTVYNRSAQGRPQSDNRQRTPSPLKRQQGQNDVDHHEGQQQSQGHAQGRNRQEYNKRDRQSNNQRQQDKNNDGPRNKQNTDSRQGKQQQNKRQQSEGDNTENQQNKTNQENDMAEENKNDVSVNADTPKESSAENVNVVSKPESNNLNDYIVSDKPDIEIENNHADTEPVLTPVINSSETPDQIAPSEPEAIVDVVTSQILDGNANITVEENAVQDAEDNVCEQIQPTENDVASHEENEQVEDVTHEDMDGISDKRCDDVDVIDEGNADDIIDESHQNSTTGNNECVTPCEVQSDETREITKPQENLIVKSVDEEIKCDTGSRRPLGQKAVTVSVASTGDLGVNGPKKAEVSAHTSTPPNTPKSAEVSVAHFSMSASDRDKENMEIEQVSGALPQRKPRLDRRANSQIARNTDGAMLNGKVNGDVQEHEQNGDDPLH